MWLCELIIYNIILGLFLAWHAACQDLICAINGIKPCRLTSWAFLVDFHTELSWRVCLKTVTVHHSINGCVKRSFLWTKVGIFIAVTLITLYSRPWKQKKVHHFTSLLNLPNFVKLLLTEFFLPKLFCSKHLFIESFP